MCASTLAQSDRKSLQQTEDLINVSCARGGAPSGLARGRLEDMGAMILGALNGETAEVPSRAHIEHSAATPRSVRSAVRCPRCELDLEVVSPVAVHAPHEASSSASGSLSRP
jgi:hypothetical protein